MRPILVTGGAKGFGAEICRRLALRGHDIVLHYRHSEKEATLTVETCKKCGVLADKVQGDFSSPDSVDAFIECFLDRFPQSKGLVNNVGNYQIAPLTQTESKDWHSLFQTNLFAPIALIQALLPSLKKTQGAIVNIGTAGLTTVRAITKAPAYATTKSALWSFTRSLAKELAPHQVTVNMISPGFLETAIDLKDAHIPIGRPATLTEAANTVAFFFEPENHYITGQNLEIAGGFNL